MVWRFIFFYLFLLLAAKTSDTNVYLLTLPSFSAPGKDFHKHWKELEKSQPKQLVKILNCD